MISIGTWAVLTEPAKKGMSGQYGTRMPLPMYSVPPTTVVDVITADEIHEATSVTVEFALEDGVEEARHDVMS